MPETRRIRSVGIESKGRAYFFEYDEPPPEHGQFRVQTMYSGVSAGTELTLYKGTNPYLHASWDERFGVFRNDQPAQAYPVPFVGYMEVARVVESRTPHVRVGQILAMNYGHKTGHVADPADELFVPVPDGLNPILGIFVHTMGPVCANGILHAAAELVGPDVRGLEDGVRDRYVLVTGGGVVGLLTAMFARMGGACEVAVAESLPRRLKAIANLGLTPINTNEVEPWQYCKQLWHHGRHDRGADVVFQCRARSESLAAALRSLRPQGAVIDMAFYQTGADQLRLGEEFHHNGLIIRCAQINRVPRGLAGTWTRRRLCEETNRLLLRHGDAIRANVITNVAPFDEAPQLFASLTRGCGDSIQAVLEV